MSAVEAACPACGAPVEFKIGSSVVMVCQYCHSVVARGDRRLEDLGKVSDVAETDSPLQLGVRGEYRGVPFELTGRAQLGHGAGGVWDEWYAAFADGRWGWVAEAQGKFYLTFHRPLSTKQQLPAFEQLSLGEPVLELGGAGTLRVAEKGEARPIAAEGEIPYRLEPGRRYAFADLSGPGGAFGTIDYSEQPPLMFLGREVTLADLGIAESARGPRREPRQVSALQLACPQCGGALSLRAPDKSERVTCPNCGSLLDVNQGKLEFFKALKTGRERPVIALGSVGELDGAKLTAIGFMIRSVVLEGTRYYWQEYLLYHPRVGFRWLVRSDNHWSLVRSIALGDVSEADRRAYYEQKKFKLFQDAVARVEHVEGEFYWKVTVKEMVHTLDYVCPPEILSKEVSLPTADRAADAAAEMLEQKRSRKRKRLATSTSGEIHWSLGTYLAPSQVEQAFGLAGLPRPSAVGPNQPFRHKAIYKYWSILTAAAVVLAILVGSTSPQRRVWAQRFMVSPLAQSSDGQILFSDPFELRGRQNLRITAHADVDNSWLYLEGDLYNEQTGLVQQFSIPIEYYHGVDGGEAWREGNQTSVAYLSALPAGQYTLRLEVLWERWQQPVSLDVAVEQGVPHWLHFALLFGALALLPAVIAIVHFSFEVRRWQDSAYNPYPEFSVDTDSD